ncbi:MAG: prolyl oligopeptidase family serine peptidase [Candidatus Hydrogenedentota bacterium]
MLQQFTSAGFAIAGIDVGESYGSPDGVKLYSALYDELVVNRGFAPKVTLLARSRGGLMLLNWAARYPEKVACIAGIYPVCNLESYPGLERACGAYGLTAEQLEEQLSIHNPVNQLQGLASAKVPIYLLHGDSDEVVPLEANSGTLAKNYRTLGGPITLHVVPGGGHSMWEGWFHHQRLVDFVLNFGQSRRR